MSDKDKGKKRDDTPEQSVPEVTGEGQPASGRAKVAPDRMRLKDVYPKASSLLRTPKRLSEIKGAAIYVLDASALLSPYDSGKETLAEFNRILAKLSEDGRLRVPGQALREYVNRRATKITLIYHGLKQRLSQTASISKIDVRMIQSMGHQKRLNETMEASNKASDAYRAELKKLIAEVEDWNWNDPVSQLYGTVFHANHIIDCELSDDELRKDFQRRIDENLPPVGDDATKPEGIGDTVIWHTMIQIAKGLKKSIVFVSNETKADWMQTSGKDVLAVRYELLYEFHQATGQDIAICDYAKFLEINGADKEAVSDATSAVEASQRGNVAANSILLQPGEFVGNKAPQGFFSMPPKFQTEVWDHVGRPISTPFHAIVPILRSVYIDVMIFLTQRTTTHSQGMLNVNAFRDEIRRIPHSLMSIVRSDKELQPLLELAYTIVEQIDLLNKNIEFEKKAMNTFSNALSSELERYCLEYVSTYKKIASVIQRNYGIIIDD